MKKIIIGSLIAFALLVSLIGLFYHASNLHDKVRTLKSEYDAFVKLKENSQKGIPKNNQTLLKSIEELVKTLELKNNLESLKSINDCIEISLKDLSQESLIEFLKKLDALPPFRILKSNFASSSSGKLGLNLVLAPPTVQAEATS